MAMCCEERRVFRVFTSRWRHSTASCGRTLFLTRDSCVQQSVQRERSSCWSAVYHSSPPHTYIMSAVDTPLARARARTRLPRPPVRPRPKNLAEDPSLLRCTMDGCYKLTTERCRPRFCRYHCRVQYRIDEMRCPQDSHTPPRPTSSSVWPQALLVHSLGPPTVQHDHGPLMHLPAASSLQGPPRQRGSAADTRLSATDASTSHAAARGGASRSNPIGLSYTKAEDTDVYRPLLLLPQSVPRDSEVPARFQGSAKFLENE